MHLIRRTENPSHIQGHPLLNAATSLVAALLLLLPLASSSMADAPSPADATLPPRQQAPDSADTEKEAQAYAPDAKKEGRVPQTGTPHSFVAVEKSSRRLHWVCPGTDGASVVTTYVSTHGRADGDKVREGDLKTPEGIYFVMYEIERNMDGEMYGPRQFHLNYPNPVDRILGKTGTNIWIHSRDKGVKDYRSHGCVLIDPENILTLGPMLKPGTPVVLTEDLADDKHGPAKEPVLEGFPDAFRKTMDVSLDWMKALEGKSEEVSTNLASCYVRPLASEAKAIQDAMAKGQALWLRLLARGGSVAIKADTLHVFAAKNYTCACVRMSYVLDGAVHTGTNALYVMPDEKGQARIVGETWIEDGSRDRHARPRARHSNTRTQRNRS